MAGFSFNIQGLENLRQKMDQKSVGLRQNVSGVINSGALEINAEQVRRAPINLGGLRQSISVSPGDLSVSMIAAKDYAAYVEFGTGAKVDIPAGLENYAAQFKGGGKRQVNLPARAYFFPPFFEKSKQIVEQIKKILSD